MKHNLAVLYDLTVFELQLFFVTHSQSFKKIKLRIHNCTESVQPLSVNQPFWRRVQSSEIVRSQQSIE